jgi:beta-glucanase (GH16 family)
MYLLMLLGLLEISIGACAYTQTRLQGNQTQQQAPSELKTEPKQNAQSKQPAWHLVWSDEFEKSNGAVASKNWGHQVGGHGWGNQEDQYYTDRVENSRVENGLLMIEAHKEKFENKNYTSARLLSTYKWRYGRFEIRAKLPEGRGSWPAFWMLSESLFDGTKLWPDCGEIDILEHVGTNPGVIESSIHTKAYNWMNKNQKTDKIRINSPFTEFHIYAVEWYRDRIEFYVDDQFILRFNKEPDADFDKWPFDQEARIILNNAIGGSWGGKEGIDDSSFPQKYLIDYVRVYQK